MTMDRPSEASWRQEEAIPNILEQNANSDNGRIEENGMRHDNDASPIAELRDSSGGNEQPNTTGNEEAVNNEEGSASSGHITSMIHALFDRVHSNLPSSGSDSSESAASDTQPHASLNQIEGLPDDQEENSILVSRLGETSDKTFKSFRKLEKYVRRKAVKEGFNFTIGRSNCSRDSNGLHRVELLCHQHNRGWSGEKRPRGARNGTNCSFRLLATADDQEKWSYKVMGEHNHLKEWSRDTLAKAVRLPEEIKKDILELMAKNKRHKEIYEIISFKYKHNTIARTSVRNFVKKRRAQLSEGSTPALELYAHLSSKNFFVEMAANENRDANRIFFASRGHARLLCHYGNVLVMDCTYKTNSHKLPLFHVIGLSPYNTTFQVAFAFMGAETESFYVWALKKLKQLYPRGKGPSVLVTGQDLALAKAIGEEFPDAKHLLCKWHIKKDVKKKVRSLQCSKERKERLNNEWYSCMQAKTEEEFNRKYQKFKKDHADLEDLLGYLENFLEPYKEKYVDAWVNKVRHYGITATSRVEGSHSHIKDRIRSRFRELTYVVDKIDRYCQTELEGLEDRVSTDRSALLGARESALFAPLVLGISNFCMKRMKNEYKKIDMPDDADIMNRSPPLVSRIQALANDAVTCECESKLVFGIPCQHVIASRIVQRRPIALNDIDGQWKISYPLRDDKLLLKTKSEITEKSVQRRCMKAIKLLRHHDVKVQRDISQLFLEACKQPPVLRNVVIAKKRKGRPVGSVSQGRNTVECNEGGDVTHQIETSHGAVPRKRKRRHVESELNPPESPGRGGGERVATGAAQRAQNARQSDEPRAKRKRQCSNCHQSGHDLRNCPGMKNSKGKKGS